MCAAPKTDVYPGPDLRGLDEEAQGGGSRHLVDLQLPSTAPQGARGREYGDSLKNQDPSAACRGHSDRAAGGTELQLSGLPAGCLPKDPTIDHAAGDEVSEEVLVAALPQSWTAAEQEEGTSQELRQAERAVRRIAAPPGLPNGLAVLRGELLLLMTNVEEG